MQRGEHLGCERTGRDAHRSLALVLRQDDLNHPNVEGESMRVIPDFQKQPSNYIHVLRERALAQGQRPAYTFLREADQPPCVLTYQELDERARTLATLLAERFAPGDRALLLFPHGPDYIIAFFGCLYANLIAVPVYPPRLSKQNRGLARLTAIVSDAQARVALTVSEVRAKTRARLTPASPLSGLSWIAIDEVRKESSAEWREPQIDRDSVAFVQYTSGTTGKPKGVMVSHANLLHNQSLLKDAFHHDRDTVIAGWLPMFHDMGLVGNVLHPIYLGAEAVLMSPMAFLQKPLRWLQAISDYGASTSGGPNFAYDLCVQKIGEAERENLDLSRWRVAFNGAEPVRSGTIEGFSAAFAGCGFRKAAFYPCYGLAEACLIVSGADALAAPVVRNFDAAQLAQSVAPVASSADARPRTLVSCGRVLGNQRVEIVHPETRQPCAPGQVGEIWIAGPSVARGYWNNPLASGETFSATIEQQENSARFLRTGDLGLMLDGELFVAGRLKDLIIIRGRNFYPQDIELVVQQSIPGGLPNACAAFAIEKHGEEQLVVVQELLRTTRAEQCQEIITAIRRAVIDEFGVSIRVVVLIRQGSLPRTSSGKIQRHLCRQQYLQHELPVIEMSLQQIHQELSGDDFGAFDREEFLQQSEAQQRRALLQRLLIQSAALLGVEPEDLNEKQSFSSIGLDSLQLLEMQARCEAELPVRMSLTDLFAGASFEQVAESLAAQLRGRAQLADTPPRQDSPRKQAQPVSIGQRALLYLHLLESKSSAYNISRALRVQGDIDATALASAIHKLAQRHTILGARYTLEQGQFSNTADPHSIEFKLVNTAGWQEEEIRRYLDEEANRAFDLLQGPVLRVHLLQGQTGENYLLVTIHHVVADLWSMGIFFRELVHLYEAELATATAQLAPLASEYSDYIAWQKDLLQGETGARLKLFWQQQLTGELPGLNLPTDRPRPPAQTFAGATYDFKLNADLMSGLRLLCQQRGATLFMGLLAVYSVLLHRCTGQEDLIIGIPSAGRRRLDFSGLIGYFVNPLPLRLRVKDAENLTSVLAHVRQQTLTALAHGDYPLGSMIEGAELRRDLNRAPLFQTMFVMQDTSLVGADAAHLVLGQDGGEFKFGPHDASSVAVQRRGAQVDLLLMAAEAGDELHCSFEYNSDLFERATIERLVKHWQSLLSELLSKPESPVDTLSLMSGAERRQILVEWNRRETDYPANLLLHQLIEAQAQKTPDAVAVCFGSAQMTYSEMESAANSLAHLLRQRGVTQDSVVGLALERCPEMMVAVLGILKAGAAYLPLDQQHPAERLAFMLADAGCAAVIIKAAQAPPVLREHPQLIDLDEVWAQLVNEPPAAPPVTACQAQNLANVLYTSGSTGQPKGVMSTHSGICNRLLWMQDAYGLTPQDRVLHKTPLTFDVSGWELFWPLINGACLVIAPPGAQHDASRLADIIREEQVTVVHFVPSMLRAFLRSGQPEALPLRLVVCSGEELTPQLVRQCERALPASVQNLYGPTEASIDVTFWDCGTARERELVPIGFPIANTQIFILDKHMEPAAIGVAGELYIAGRGLARGYLNRPSLTAERFLPNPFSQQPGERIFRTGDLARYSPDGAIEFLGRLDYQVKIRGQRIELGEIEAILSQHPALKEVAVVAQTHGSEKHLVAFMVAEEAAPRANISELRHFLQQRLPGYMVPALYVFLAQLPLNASGKLDRKRLAEWQTQTGVDWARDSRYVPPDTAEQELLVAIWEQVLQQQSIGIDDNYFQLGGDSIRSIEIISLCHEAGLELKLEDLLQHQTVRELSALTERAETTVRVQRELTSFEMVSAADRALLPPEVKDAYPMSFLQQGLVFHSQYGADYEIYVTSLHLHARWDELRMQSALSRMAERHEILRTSFDLKSFSEPLQLVHPEASIPLVVEDLRNLSAAEQSTYLEHWIEEEKGRRLVWEQPPLVRVTVHRRTDESFQLTLSEPLFDGWSVTSFFTELLSVYGQLELTPELPPTLPLASSCRDFIALEREALASKECQNYWESTLHDWTTTRLPRCWQSSPETSARGIRRYQVKVQTEVFQGLREVARQAHAPLKSVLLAAHVKVMSLLAGQTEVLTGLIANGRPEQRDGEQVLGTHLNAIPFRLDLVDDTWLALVRQALAMERETLPYRRYPIAELQRRHHRQMFFESVFNFTNFRLYRRVEELTGLKILDGYASEQTYYPLTTQFNVDHEQAELVLALDYMASEFPAQQIETCAGYFIAALQAIATQPTARHRETVLLSAAEREQLVHSWNETAQAFEAGANIVARIERHAKESPEAVAVCCAGQQLTYRELNSRANQLAHLLCRSGGGPERLVCVLLERSVDAIVGLLAVLKTGGAYVPLDPATPPQRLAVMIEDAQAPVVITQQSLREHLPPQAQVVLLDRDRAQLTLESEANLSCDIAPEQLAYVIYTSGSTGKPKAVGISHKGLLNLVNWHLHIYRLSSNDRTTYLAGAGFDASVWEIWPTLAAGASLHLPDEMTRLAPVELQRWLLNEKITVSFIPTPLAEALLELDWPTGAGSLKFMLTGGDKLHSYLQEPLNFKLINHYGPTENTVVATVCEVGLAPFAEAVPPIGRPIANTQVYLLDALGQPVPVGVPGEIYLGGDSLARGYWQQPDMTADRFVPHPFSTTGGARLYRTGDLACYRPDGQIEFLGRCDQQVKVRGNRVELSEVEAHLRAHALVKEAVVLTGQTPIGETFLKAYLIPEPEAPLVHGELRDFLQQRLPAYMIPTTFMLLDHLPLTPSGKIDRQALLLRSEGALARQRKYVAPRDEVEARIAEVWSSVLKQETVGIDDDFFELGGHSLLATQIISRLRVAFGMDFPLSLIFDHPTVGRMAASVRELHLLKLEDDELSALLRQLEGLSDEEVKMKLLS